MDFSDIINDLLSSGDTVENIAKKFTENLNKAAAANKSKEEKDKYTRDLADSVYEACDNEAYSTEVAARIATLALVEKYPDLTLKELDIFCKTTKEAIEITMEAQKKFHDKDTQGALDMFLDAMGFDKEFQKYFKRKG